MILVSCFKDSKGVIRCNKCRHAVKIHKVSKQGYNHTNGYCQARYCNCDVPFEVMGERYHEFR